jgi:hypothetical protein
VSEGNRIFFYWLKWWLKIGDQILGNYQFFLGSDKKNLIVESMAIVDQMTKTF